MTTPNDLSDNAQSVFAFAAYHQLKSGDVITSFVSVQACGNDADSAAIEELTALELASRSADGLRFSNAGQLTLSPINDSIHGSW